MTDEVNDAFSAVGVITPHQFQHYSSDETSYETTLAAICYMTMTNVTTIRNLNVPKRKEMSFFNLNPEQVSHSA